MGAEVTGVAIPLARVAGIALTALGIGCCAASVSLAMWLYTAMVTVFLAYLGAATDWHGQFLWPAVGAHALLTALLARNQLAASPRPAAVPL